jgi:hypothetical protein
MIYSYVSSSAHSSLSATCTQSPNRQIERKIKGKVGKGLQPTNIRLAKSHFAQPYGEQTSDQENEVKE